MRILLTLVSPSSETLLFAQIHRSNDDEERMFLLGSNVDHRWHGVRDLPLDWHQLSQLAAAGGQ